MHQQATCCCRGHLNSRCVWFHGVCKVGPEVTYSNNLYYHYLPQVHKQRADLHALHEKLFDAEVNKIIEVRGAHTPFLLDTLLKNHSGRFWERSFNKPFQPFAQLPEGCI